MRKILGLTEAGIKKLERHLAMSGNQVKIPFAQAVSNLIEVVTPQVNNQNPELAVEPWYFAMGVAGTTPPKSADEHETSDYEEVCLSYNETDLQIENTTSTAATPPKYEEIDFKDVVSANFSVGRGVIQLLPGMSDEQILSLIKNACLWSEGMAFQVVPPRTCDSKG